MATMRFLRNPALGHWRAVPARGMPHQTHLVRLTHIFSFAVRDLLEIKLLGETTRDPLSLSQYHLLRAVALDGHFHSGELASFMGVSAPAGTKNINKLERLGFIVRNPSKRDRRVTLLSASAKGRRLVRRYEERKARSLTPVLEGFSRQDLRIFARLLERFTLSLIGQENKDSRICLYCAAHCMRKCPVARVRGACPFVRLRGAHGAEASVGVLP